LSSGPRLSSVEIFPPPSSDACSIPNLPRPRDSHTISLLSGGRLVLCGGDLASAEKSCISWTRGSTSWTHLHTTSTARLGHVAWSPPSLPDSIVLLGGFDIAARFTAEIVPGGGTFALHHSGERACGIPDEDTIVMTGGTAHNHVTRYNVNGFVEELPQLPGERYAHACAALPSTKHSSLLGARMNTTTSPLCSPSSLEHKPGLHLPPCQGYCTVLVPQLWEARSG